MGVWISSSSPLQPHSVLTSCLTDSATVSCSECCIEAVCQEDKQEGGLQLSVLASDGAVGAKSIFLNKHSKCGVIGFYACDMESDCLSECAALAINNRGGHRV